MAYRIPVIIYLIALHLDYTQMPLAQFQKNSTIWFRKQQQLQTTDPQLHFTPSLLQCATWVKCLSVTQEQDLTFLQQHSSPHVVLLARISTNGLTMAWSSQPSCKTMLNIITICNPSDQNKSLVSKLHCWENIKMWSKSSISRFQLLMEIRTEICYSHVLISHIWLNFLVHCLFSGFY